MKKFVALIALLHLCSASLFKQHLSTDGFKESFPGAKEYKFENRIDHFDPASTKTYSQKYWIIDDYWDQDSGPVILYVFGEYPASMSGPRTMHLELAQRLHARIFALEHRFYGESQPCKDWSMNSMKLLSHHQSMADIANFIETQNQKMKEINRKWVLIGGSYAGALVVWFQIKYPYLVEVTYSSSGVINEIVDYYQYMGQIFTDMSKDALCLNVIKQLNEYAIKIITKGSKSDRAQLKKLMGAEKLEDLDFLMYFTDIYVGMVQYSARNAVCKDIKSLLKYPDMETKIVKYAEIGINSGENPNDYLWEIERKEQVDITKWQRQWMYQTCTAFGYFQTGRMGNPTRSIHLNIHYFENLCKLIFGEGVFPVESYTKAITGDLRLLKIPLQATNVDNYYRTGVMSQSVLHSQVL